MSKNTNCLEGIRCPKCGYEDGFNVSITVTTTVYMTDDGFSLDEGSNAETNWDDDDYMSCIDCGYEAVVALFRVEED